jgi:hypothetical protein
MLGSTPSLPTDKNGEEDLLRDSHLSESFDYGVLNQGNEGDKSVLAEKISDSEDSLFDQVDKNQNFEKSDCDGFDASPVQVDSESGDGEANRFMGRSVECEGGKLVANAIVSAKTIRTNASDDYVNVEQLLEDIMDNNSQDSMLVLGNQAFLVESGMTGQLPTSKLQSKFSGTGASAGNGGPDENTSKRVNKSVVTSREETPDTEFLKEAKSKYAQLKIKELASPSFPVMNLDSPNQKAKNKLCLSSTMGPVFQSMNVKAGSQCVDMPQEKVVP